MRRHQPAPGQGALDFYSLRQKAFRRPWGVDGQVKHLIRVLEDFCNKSRDVCWPSYEQIAKAMDVSVTTVGRLIRKAIDEELLIEVARRDRFANAKKYKIRRANYHARAGLLDELLTVHPEAVSPARLQGETENLTHQDGRSESNPHLPSCKVSGETSPAKLAGENDSDLPSCSISPAKVEGDHLIWEYKKNTPPSPPAPVRTPTSGWKEAVEAILEFPVDNWSPAVAAAKAAGCGPEHVLAIVAEAQRRRCRWKKPAGVLYNRLLNAHPSRAPTEGWPGDREAAMAQRRAVAEAAHRTAEDEREAKREIERVAEQRRRVELEETFGADLDAMAPECLHDLVRSAIGSNQIAWTKWVRDPDISAEIFRGPVLRYMAKQEGVTVTDEPAGTLETLETVECRRDEFASGKDLR